MKLNRSIVFVLYALTALMMLMPLGETVLSVWPLRLGEPGWRFGAAGLFSRALMTPMLGLVLLAVLGFLLNHRRAVQTAAVLAVVGTMILLVAEVLFMLDAVQMRAQVREEARLAFDLASLLAFFKIGLSIVITAVLAVGAWKTARSSEARTRTARSDAARALPMGRARRAEAAPAPDPVPPATSSTTDGD
jgi:hypothetical protein